MVSNLGHSELLAGRVALVTGGSRGIGAAVCRALAAHGAAVGVGYVQDADAAERLVAAVEGDGGRAYAARADVTDPTQVQAMVAEVEDRFGPADVVVNNALRRYTFDPLGRRTAWQTSWPEYERQLEGSLGGAVNVVRAALPGMQARGDGRIVNIVSDLVERPAVPYPDYTTAKAALLGWSRTLAAELGPFGITVNCVAPGLVHPTDSSRAATDEQRDTVEETTPLRRLGHPDDVAGAVLFLASGWSSFVTGACLFVDGGLVMR